MDRLKIWHLLPILFALALLSGCGRSSNEDLRLETIKGHWGHLTRVDEVAAPNALYLSHLPSNRSYKVCIADYMEKRYPGIKNELEAAINIWAHYIGRKVKVEFTTRTLSGPRSGEDPTDQMERYYQSCGTDQHLVVGMADLDGRTVGMTPYTYSYRPKNGRREVVSFKRGLFLKEYRHQEDPWASLQDVLGRSLSSQEILNLLKERKTRFILPENKDFLTLQVLAHEVGHAWGLCDQYALAGNQTNCDPDWAVLSPEGHIILNDDAVMSSANNWYVPAYLHDDDIVGIRKMAQRFSQNSITDFQSIEVAQIAPIRPIEHFQIVDAHWEPRNARLVVQMAMITSQNAEISASIILNDGHPINFGKSIISRKITTRDYTYRLGVSWISPSEISAIKVKLKVGEEEREETFLYNAQNNDDI